MHRSGIGRIVASILQAVVSGYIVAVLTRNTHRFYHLWNKISVLLFGCMLVNACVRAGFEIRDMTTDHASLTELHCQISFAAESFFTTAVQLLYILFTLTLCVPRCAEPSTAAGIDWALVPCVVVSFGWATIATVTPLFMKENLEHQRAWCWPEDRTSAPRVVFNYVPSFVALLVAFGFVMWIVELDVRIGKGRILALAVTQLLVVAVFAAFCIVEFVQAGALTPGTSTFDSLAIFFALHDLVRSAAFIVAEKLYPTQYVDCLCFAQRQDDSGAPPSQELGDVESIGAIAIADDTLTYFVSVLQRNGQHGAGVDGAAEFGRNDDEYSDVGDALRSTRESSGYGTPGHGHPQNPSRGSHQM